MLQHELTLVVRAKIPFKLIYTNSLVNADTFYANFTNTTFQKITIPHLTRTMKQKVLQYLDLFHQLWLLITINLLNVIFG